MTKPGSSEKEKAMVFIDGNNFYHNTKKTSGVDPGAIDFLKLSKYICSHYKCERERTFYYNSVPSIDSVSPEVYRKHMKFLSGIRNLPEFSVRTRKLQSTPIKEKREKKKKQIEDLDVCEECEKKFKKMCMECLGNVKQREKGIDIMIAVDMLEKALKDEYDRCILVSGDADFVPVFELIKENGKKVCSASVYKGYANELRDKFDYFIIDEMDLMKKCYKDSS